MEAVINGHLVIHDDPVSLVIDSDGRWRTFRMGDRRFRRLVDGQIVEIVDDEPKEISKNVMRGLHAMIAHYLELFAEKARNRDIPKDSCNVTDPALQATLFRKALEFTSSGSDHIMTQYLMAYPEPIPMLPPDRYRDVVLLPATGCPSGECTFCTLYPNTKFQVLTNAQFEEHIDRVRKLFGTAITGKTGVFLGSASAMSLSQRRLLSILSTIYNKLGSYKRGVASFFDPYHAPKRTAGDFSRLKELGLQQVTIGLESGSGLLRQAWRKSGELNVLKDTVNTLKESEIQVALTILTGFHENSNYLNHVKSTLAFIRSLPLDSSDILYLSPLYPSPITKETSTEQLWRLKRRLQEITDARVVPYFINKFRYYA